MKLSLFRGIALLASLAAFAVAPAAMAAKGGERKVVIQVSSADEATQTLALNVASNVQKEYGMDNVTIEVVAYGPGLSLLTQASTAAERVSSLSQQNITFSACANTMKGIEKKTGKAPVLIDGVQVVPAGAGRIIELEGEGYAYLRP